NGETGTNTGLEIHGGTVENTSPYVNSAIIANSSYITITGGTIRSNNGTAINIPHIGGITIPSGTPMIKGGNMAMNKAPDLTGYSNVQILASKNDKEGTDAEGITKEDIDTDVKVQLYKYLKFKPE